MDERTQKIIDWRETINTLPNDYFFELIHIYLGEVKTPYNKQKLIESLASFLRNKENRENIIALLSDDDIKILTAVKFIGNPNIEKIEKFFGFEFMLGNLYSRISSLEERLLIFTKIDKISGEKVISINPLLEDDLEPYLELRNLVSTGEITDEENAEKKSTPILTEEFLCAFISFLFYHNDFCKADKTLKKKTADDLKVLFNKDDMLIFQKLIMSLKNLLILNNDEINLQKLEQFSNLAFIEQLSYLAAGSIEGATIRTIQMNAKLFKETFMLISGEKIEKNKIFELAFLIKEQNGGEKEFSSSRFSRMLMSIQNKNSDKEHENFDFQIMNEMIDFAVAAGYFSAKNNFVIAKEVPKNKNADKKNILNVDAGFTVTIMPGLSLKDFIPLLRFMTIQRFDVAAVFEITKASVMKSFNLGFTDKKIIEILKEYMQFSIPEPLTESLAEWYDAFNSGMLYQGFVLKLSEKNAFIAERSETFSSHIKEVLAPGVFFLDFKNENDAQAELLKLGFDFIGNAVTISEKSTALSFTPLRETSNFSKEIFCLEKSMKENVKNEKDILRNLEENLSKLELTMEQKDGLLNRIERKVIVNPEQLRPESVRFELMEATGMNFTAKIHLLESAFQNKNLIEMELAGTKEQFVCSIKSIVKNAEPAFVSVHRKNISENDADVEIEIAKISRVKKIRKSLALERD